VGERGILPAGSFLSILGPELGARAFCAVPTLFWLHLSDGMLLGTVVAGMGLSLLLLFDLAPGPILLVLWFLYLSIVSVGQEFFSFQWDGLLLEAGLLAVLAAPWRWRPRFTSLPAPPAFPLFLLRWLLFRFILLNGLVKLSSGDPSWRDLSALSFHYFTQPLPSPVSWWFHHLPLGFHQTSAVVLFAVELGTPFLIFGGWRLRRIAFGGIVGLQGLILLTGNLAFLNWLTIVLAFLLLDDACFVRSRRLEEALIRPAPACRLGPARRVVTYGLGGFLLAWSVLVSFERLTPFSLPGWLETAEAYVDPWRSVNPYGLFAVMTKSRTEITIEGSNDGVHWQAYPFRYKPGAAQAAPGWIAPYQPRLDWQMWFAALSNGEKTPWFPNLLARLLLGSPDVLRLFAANPFPDHPPRLVRALSSTYRFTTPQERAATGAWWKVEPAGWYYPAISLRAPAHPVAKP